MIRRDISQVAEDAIRLVSTYVDPAGSGPEGAPRHVVLGAASAAEAYVDSVLAHLVAEFSKRTEPIGVAMAEAVRKDVDRAWPQRRKWLAAAIGVKLENEPIWTRLMVLVDLRNAIAHGTGGLSPMQRAADAKKYIKLFRDTFACQHVGGRLIVPGSAALTAVSISREFILSVDARAVACSPSLRLVALR